MLRVVPGAQEVVVGIPGGLAPGKAKGAWDDALPQVAEKKSCWRRSRPRIAVACSLLAGLLATVLFFAVTAVTVRSSVPQLRPVRVALDASSDVTSLTASVDAAVGDVGQHTVRLKGGICSVDTLCVGGARCTILVAEISDVFYSQDSRVQFVAQATQSWPQNVRLAFKHRGQGLGVSCNLRVSVDLYKTGIVVEHDSSWRFEDISEFAASSGLFDGVERPLLTIRRDGWTSQPGAAASVNGDFVAELALPVGPLVETLEAVSVGVKANVAYVESSDRALEGRFSVDADVRVARNASDGYAVVSLPFTLFARADVPSLAGYMPMAGAHAESAGKRGNMHLFLKDHSLVFEAAPDSQAAAGILGQVHVLGWRRDYREHSRAGSSGGSRALTTAEHAPAGHRRLLGLFGIEGILGFELQALETHHRFYLDDDAFIGVDFKMVEGPPFVIALGTRVKSSIADDIFGEKSEFVFNMTFSVHDGDETAEIDVSLESLKDGASDVVLNFNTALDVKGETFDVKANLGDSDVNATFQAGIHASDALVFLNASIDTEDGPVKASISGDFDDLEFQAGLVIMDMVRMGFTGVEDMVDLDAFLDMGDNKTMTVAIDYRRTDVGEDVEHFTANMTLQEMNGAEYHEAHVANWTSPSNATPASVLSKSTSSVTLKLDHGRRRTAAAGGSRELRAYMSMLPECVAEGDGAPSESAALCCDDDGSNCESCCEGTLQGAMVEMMGGSMGASMGTEGLDVLLTDVAGAEGDMDFFAAWNQTDQDSPRVQAELRVVDGVSELDFTLNETFNKTLLMGTVEWEEITGGHRATVSLSDSSEMLLKAAGEWSETTDAAGLITRYGAGSISNGSDVLMGGGNGTWTESADGETHTLVWNLHNESESQVSKGKAYLGKTGAGVSMELDAGQEMLDGEVFFEELSSGDVDARAHARLDGSELVYFIGDWDNAEGWGGDLNVTVGIDGGNETIVALAEFAEGSDVKSVAYNVHHNAEYIIGASVDVSDGGLASTTPAFVNVTVFEGANQTGLIALYGRITNPDYALDTDSSRVILLKHPGEAYGYIDMRDDDAGSLDRMATLSINISEATDGDGSIVSVAAVVSESNSTEVFALRAACDTSDATQMAVSAGLHVEGDSVLNVSGVWPYKGDYMSGNAEVHVENHTQVIFTKISRGFLVQSSKPTGYDALWLNFGTVIEDEMLLNVTDLYIERGPDIAWSGVGWNLALAEKNGTGWKTTYTHSFDIDFVPGTPPPLGDDVIATKFDLEVEITDMSTFDVTSVVESIAAASGIDSEDVIVEEMSFEVKATYAFDASVTEEQATEAVALANDVLESQVSLTAVNGRRLDPSGAASSLRRLAAQQYDTVITTTDTEQAKSVMTSSADVAALTTTLAQVAPEAPAPTIEVIPVVEVTVKTALVSKTGTAVAVPTASALNTELSEALGQTVEVEVANTATSSCSGGVCTTETTEAIGDDGTASGAPQLVAPLLSASCAGLIAAFAAVF